MPGAASVAAQEAAATIEPVVKPVASQQLILTEGVEASKVALAASQQLVLKEAMAGRDALIRQLSDEVASLRAAAITSSALLADMSRVLHRCRRGEGCCSSLTNRGSGRLGGECCGRFCDTGAGATQPEYCSNFCYCCDDARELSGSAAGAAGAARSGTAGIEVSSQPPFASEDCRNYQNTRQNLRVVVKLLDKARMVEQPRDKLQEQILNPSLEQPMESLKPRDLIMVQSPLLMPQKGETLQEDPPTQPPSLPSPLASIEWNSTSRVSAHVLFGDESDAWAASATTISAAFDSAARPLIPPSPVTGMILQQLPTTAAAGTPASGCSAAGADQEYSESLQGAVQVERVEEISANASDVQLQPVKANKTPQDNIDKHWAGLPHKNGCVHSFGTESRTGSLAALARPTAGRVGRPGPAGGRGPVRTLVLCSSNSSII
jgi:hypothetical protein